MNRCDTDQTSSGNLEAYAAVAVSLPSAPLDGNSDEKVLSDIFDAVTLARSLYSIS